MKDHETCFEYFRRENYLQNLESIVFFNPSCANVFLVISFSAEILRLNEAWVNRDIYSNAINYISLYHGNYFLCNELL